jgi:hypothetical protein
MTWRRSAALNPRGEVPPPPRATAAADAAACWTSRPSGPSSGPCVPNGSPRSTSLRAGVGTSITAATATTSSPAPRAPTSASTPCPSPPGIPRHPVLLSAANHGAKEPAALRKRCMRCRSMGLGSYGNGRICQVLLTLPLVARRGGLGLRRLAVHGEES